MTRRGQAGEMQCFAEGHYSSATAGHTLLVMAARQPRWQQESAVVRTEPSVDPPQSIT